MPGNGDRVQGDDDLVLDSGYPLVPDLSLIHISEPTSRYAISDAVLGLK